MDAERRKRILEKVAQTTMKFEGGTADIVDRKGGVVIPRGSSGKAMVYGKHLYVGGPWGVLELPVSSKMDLRKVRRIQIVQ